MDNNVDSIKALGELRKMIAEDPAVSGLYAELNEMDSIQLGSDILYEYKRLRAE
jgi:hypothetical protein